MIYIFGQFVLFAHLQIENRYISKIDVLLQRIKIMFERTEDAKRQILRDKHTLLEDYVTEYLFEHQFFIAD